MAMRTYGDGCGIAHALDLVGERWALLIVRELLLGPKRFTDLRAGLPNASPNVLAQRLRELEAGLVVERRKLPPPASSWVYELTGWGRDLEPVVRAFGLWAVRSPTFPRDVPYSADSLVLALGTLFDAEAAGDLRATYELRMDESSFHVRIADGRLELGRGPAAGADATVETDTATLGALLWNGRDLAEAERAGDVAIQGDRDAVARFAALFPRPEPVAA
jgi:DNA-binding HxlR family transcriptional regulator